MLTLISSQWRRVSLIVMAGLTLNGCAPVDPLLAPDVAQPGTRPTRNFTSFSTALGCMDGLLQAQNRRPILISSSDIPDSTNAVRVGADDMLINAINQMTRRSKSYIFLDQAIVRDPGEMDLRVVLRNNPARPQYYIRGSISQLDSNTVDDSATIGGSADPDATAGLTRARISGGQKLSIVSVDLHLVRYPSRQVVPGLSVANSMTVVSRNRNVSAAGLISMSGLDLSLRMNRVESTGQAVRNLIELGVIELLGRHSGLPYWTCLSDPSTDPNANSLAERNFVQQSNQQIIAEAQHHLSQLNHLTEPYTLGQLDHPTRAALADFQAHERLIASGTADFDTIHRLRRRAARQKASATPPVASNPRPGPPPPQTRQPQKATTIAEDGYIPLHLLIESLNP